MHPPFRCAGHCSPLPPLRPCRAYFITAALVTNGADENALPSAVGGAASASYALGFALRLSTSHRSDAADNEHPSCCAIRVSCLRSSEGKVVVSTHDYFICEMKLRDLVPRLRQCRSPFQKRLMQDRMSSHTAVVVWRQQRTGAFPAKPQVRLAESSTGSFPSAGRQPLC